MKKSICSTFALVALCCASILVQGCKESREHGTAPASGTTSSGTAGHDHAHQSKYNEVLVEFPGHKFAMEIIDEKETTGLVTAFLTDAHFDPVEVDTKEVRLNFMIDGKPTSYTLFRAEQESGKPATFTRTDMELATLLCEGWQGDATASVMINGTPYSAKLVKLAGHENHDH